MPSNQTTGFLKRGFLVMASGLVLILAVWPAVVEQKKAEAFSLVLQEMDSLPEDMEITHPHYVGTDSQGRRIQVRAAVGKPDAPRPTQIVLEDLKIDITDKEGEMSLQSKTGTYVLEKNLLNLKGDIHIRRSDGYETTTQEMDIDLKEGRLKTPQPFVLKGPLGEIEGHTLEGSREENEIDVGGRVKMTLTPSQEN